MFSRLDGKPSNGSVESVWRERRKMDTSSNSALRMKWQVRYVAAVQLLYSGSKKQGMEESGESYRPS